MAEKLEHGKYMQHLRAMPKYRMPSTPNALVCVYVVPAQTTNECWCRRVRVPTWRSRCRSVLIDVHRVHLSQNTIISNGHQGRARPGHCQICAARRHAVAMQCGEPGRPSVSSAQIHTISRDQPNCVQYNDSVCIRVTTRRPPSVIIPYSR
jgi:hypothetical protein